MRLTSLDSQEPILKCISLSAQCTVTRLMCHSSRDSSSETDSLDADYLWIFMVLS